VLDPAGRRSRSGREHERAESSSTEVNEEATMGTVSRTDERDAVMQEETTARSSPDFDESNEAARSGRQRSGSGSGDGLANALGWFSIGLGLAQVAAPRGVARLIGVKDDSQNAAIMRTLGMREIASGIGILSQPRPSGWMWTRVAGDMMDLALLGSALGADGTQRNRTVAATAAVLGVTALDVLAGQRLTEQSDEETGRDRDSGRRQAEQDVTRSITINRPPEEVYGFWRQLENLPRFMRHLESVTAIDERTSHWKAKGPGGKTVEWDAVITDDRPNELISWRADENAEVRNEGTVRFRPAPGGRGTEVIVDLRYDPPAGKLGVAVAKLFHREPGQQVPDDLRRLKQVLEVGEVVVSDATVRPGRPHPAQPDDQGEVEQ
jgi:uncharacterized membrane protein